MREWVARSCRFHLFSWGARRWQERGTYRCSQRAARMSGFLLSYRLADRRNSAPFLPVRKAPPFRTFSIEFLLTESRHCLCNRRVATDCFGRSIRIPVGHLEDVRTVLRASNPPWRSAFSMVFLGAGPTGSRSQFRQSLFRRSNLRVRGPDRWHHRLL